MHRNNEKIKENARPVLLIQFRVNTAVAAHEAACFARECARAGISMETINLCAGGRLSHDTEFLQRYRGCIAGGSHYSPLDDFPERREAIDLVHKITSEDLPFLGVCFGFELLVHTLGGTIVHDPVRAEFGTNEITLTPKGEHDPLFSGLPRRFWVQHGHECLADSLPPTVISLAQNSTAPYQAVRMNGKRVWGVQFHPELSRDDMHHRMDLYAGTEIAETYFGAERRQHVKESPYAQRVLENFLYQCAG